MLGVSKKIKKATEEERQLNYGDGNLSGKEREMAGLEMQYFNAAKWFEKRVADDYRKKARNSRNLAIVFGLMAFMAVLAVMMLTPLKTVEPYVIRVDKNSGYVDIVKPTYSMNDSADVAVDKHYISSYVLAHESYNWASQKANFYFVGLTSSADVFTEYKNFQLSKKGFTETLGMQQQIKVEINSIVPLTRSKQEKLSGDNNMRSYQVRYSQTLLMADGRPVQEAKPLNWISTISINNSNPPQKEGDLWLNPKGYLTVGWEPTVTNAGDNQ